MATWEQRRANIAQTIDVLPDFRAEVREGWSHSTYGAINRLMAPENQLRTGVPCTIWRRLWSLMTRKHLVLSQDFANYFNYPNYIDNHNYSDYSNYS